MAKSDDQHRLNARQRREIDQIGQKCHLNLAPPPSSLDEITTGPKFVSLTDFIEQFDWEYADLDIVDRREIKDLAAEDFGPPESGEPRPYSIWEPTRYAGRGANPEYG